MKVCAEPGCPTLVPNGSRCKIHAREQERRRGTKQRRGYTGTHDRLRADWAPRVAAGVVRCWRCNQIIAPGSPWDLGHDDDDRAIHRGPEHAHCNRSAGGRQAHRR